MEELLTEAIEAGRRTLADDSWLSGRRILYHGGMAGSFSYEAEHLDVSLTVSEDRLFPAVRAEGPDLSWPLPAPRAGSRSSTARGAACDTPSSCCREALVNGGSRSADRTKADEQMSGTPGEPASPHPGFACSRVADLGDTEGPEEFVARWTVSCEPSTLTVSGWSG